MTLAVNHTVLIRTPRGNALARLIAQAGADSWIAKVMTTQNLLIGEEEIIAPVGDCQEEALFQ